LKKKYISILFILMTLGALSYAQENDTGVMVNENSRADGESKINTTNSIYIINSFTFDIKGYTRRDALVYKGEFKKGEIIYGADNLEKYIQDKTQLLYNERSLSSVEINYVIRDEENGMLPVDLEINIKDTWNLIALPYPKYSTNTGFDFILKARNYNFLGTMTPLRLDIGYSYDEEKKSSYLMSLDADIPFFALGYKWDFIFQNYFNYRPDTEEPFFYKNVTGLSVEIPVKTTTLGIGFDESVILNDENSFFDSPIYGDFQEGLYLSSNPYISWKIPLIQDFAGYGQISYTPEISATFNHEIGRWKLGENRIGPFLSLSNDIGFKKIDWIGNFRKGYEASINNSYDFDFYRHAEDFVTIGMNFSATGHFIITDYFGISSRLMYRRLYMSKHGNREAGDVLRGIPDKDLATDFMISLNMDFPVRILKFMPSEWISPKLRVFDFDLQLSPIVDLAFCNAIKDEDSKIGSNYLASGGLEFIVFPYFFRSLYLRISLAYNMLDIDIKNNYEFFLGIGHHY